MSFEFTDENRERILIDHALMAIRSNVPEGSNQAIVAALETLAAIGDPAALEEVEHWLTTKSLSVDYGDRDSDPSPWVLDKAAFHTMVAWWERLQLGESRSIQLVSDWMYDTRHFGSDSYTFFTQCAQPLAARVAPLLLAESAGGDKERRKRAIGGLRHAITHEGITALVGFLADPVEPVWKEARFSLVLIANPPTSKKYGEWEAHRTDVTEQLIAAMRSPAVHVRREALGLTPWFHGLQHRNSLSFPALFQRTWPVVIALLEDDDPAIRKHAAKMVEIAGYHLNLLKPELMHDWNQALQTPLVDVAALLESSDEDEIAAGLHLAGRMGADNTALAQRVVLLLPTLRHSYVLYQAAFFACARLHATGAIPELVLNLEDPKGPYYRPAAFVLARLGYGPVRPHLVRLHGDLWYGQDARFLLGELDRREGGA